MEEKRVPMNSTKNAHNGNNKSANKDTHELNEYLCGNKT